MSVISVNPIGKGRRRFSVNDRFQRETIQLYRVRTDTPTDDGMTVYLGAVGMGVPDINIPYGPDGTQSVMEITGGEQDPHDPTCWILEVKFSTETLDPGLQSLNPLNEPAHVSIDVERQQLAIEKDLDDNMIANSAGDPFDPPEAAELGVAVMSYSDNIFPVNFFDAVFYHYTCNTNVHWGLSPYSVLCSRFRLTRNFRNDQEYFQRQLELKIGRVGIGAAESFNLPFLIDAGDNTIVVANVTQPTRPPVQPVDWRYIFKTDKGYRIIGPDGKPRNAGDNGGAPPKPVPLDGNGQKLSPEDVAAGNFVQLPFRIRSDTNFSSLNLEDFSTYFQ